MKLIVGLGNPGKEYLNTRHNAGYFILDLLAKQIGESFSEESKFRGLVCKTQQLILLKPTTFMNLSGQSVRSLTDYYNIPNENVLIVHDDIDQPTGKFKHINSGGSGGHKGIISIFESLNVVDEVLERIKLGVAPEYYNPGIHKAEDFVLKPFSNDERNLLQSLYDSEIGDILKEFAGV